RHAGRAAFRARGRQPVLAARHQLHRAQAPRLRRRVDLGDQAGLQDPVPLQAGARGGEGRAGEAGARGRRPSPLRRIPRQERAGPPALKRVAIVAGESSGDLLGASLIRALRGRFPGVEFYGIAGPRMVAEGARTLFPMEKLSVRGYVEALKHLPEIFGIRQKLGAQFIEDRPDLFIGIDAPDFNLGLEKRLNSAGIRTMHYVGPSLWAWRAERIHAIPGAVDHMLVLFPFEEAIYRKAGVPVSYVGHPLADQLPLKPDRDDARAQLRLPGNLTAIALLPGSRQS